MHPSRKGHDRLRLDLVSLSIAEFYPDGVASVRLVNQTAYP
jgi:hypothetical protein